MPRRENEIIIYTPEMKELSVKINEYKMKLKEMRQKFKLYVQEQKDKDNKKKNNMCNEKDFLILRMD